jgi:hypothetical protein
MEQNQLSENFKQALSRRELLKLLLAVGGGVAASSLLPSKWSKPEIGVGALPVHAQATNGYSMWCGVYDAGTDMYFDGMAGSYIMVAGAYLVPPTAGIAVHLTFIVANAETPVNYSQVTETDQNGAVVTPYFYVTVKKGDRVALSCMSTLARCNVDFLVKA